MLDASEFKPSTPPAPANPGEISTTSWKRAMVSFSVTGGNPTGNDIDLEFDLEASTDADSYGVFIDNVILVPRVNLSIANGQGGSLLAEDKEENPGAFAVANLNDTDGDTMKDKDDNDVTGEKDLMKLVLDKPDPDKGGSVTLTVTPNTVKLWEQSTKGTEVTLRTFATTDLPKTFWVEATAKSGALRDIEIKAEYKGGFDTIKATAVWATKTGFKNKLADARWGDADDPLKTTFTSAYGGKFGIQYGAPPVNVQYAMGMEFEVSPPGLLSEPQVKFDVTRQKEKTSWSIDGAAVTQEDLEYWPGRSAITSDGPTGVDVDKSNDDAGSDDEDSTPDNDHIYSIDGPGHANDGGHDQYIRRLIFLEYVRVRFDGTAPFGNTNEGSRCSDKASWYAHMWSEKDGANYKERAGKGSGVEEGYKAILPAPTP